ncbi:MAG TPA: TonB-dependent receptor [Erythrobacter sp.]|nr:TonB-dependent receptor [Erythrobacter sp.]
MKIRNTLLAGAAIAALALPGMAQAGDLAGTVSDATDTIALRSAQVRIVEIDRVTATERDGSFLFADVPAGDYTLEISYVGAETVRRAITVPATGTVRAEIAMTGFGDDEILVVGQVANLSSALSRKKEADGVSDVLTRDAIGQFPDQNVAESLRRLPGINVLNDQGEGRFVSVRGLSPDLVSSSLNGVRLPSPEADIRAVALDVVSSDIIESIEVKKSLTPDMDADTIGASVEIETTSAFDRKTRLLTAKVEGSYNDYADEISPKGSLDFATRIGDNFGISGGVSYYRRTFETDNIEADGWEEDDGVIYAEDLEYRDYDVERERISATLGLDLRAGDSTELYARGVYSQFDDQESRRRLIFDLGDAIVTGAGRTVGYSDTDPDPDEDAAITVERDVKDRFESQKIRSLVFGGESDWGDWFANYSASWAKSSERENGSLDPIAFEREYEEEGFGVVLDFANSSIPLYSVSDPTGDFTDPGSYALNDIEFVALSDAQDEEWAAKFDLGRRFAADNGEFTVQVGFKGRWRDKTYDANVEFYENDAMTLNDALGEGQTYRLTGIGPVAGFTEGSDFFRANFGDFELQDVDSAFDSAVEDFAVAEDIMAGYLLGRWESADLRVVYGLRYEHTDNTLVGNNVLLVEEDGTLPDGSIAADDTVLVSPVSIDKNYDHWLPSLNLRYEPQTDLVLRAGFYRSIVRPSPFQQAPHFAVEEADDGERSGEFGNPALLPTEAWNFDAAAEYYMSATGALHASVFYKSLDNFIVDVNTDVAGSFRGIAFDEATIARNGDEADIFGIELGFSQAFTGTLDGFVVQANYTFTDADGTVTTLASEGPRSIPLPATAKHTANFSVGYDKGPVDIRLSGTYREKYLDELSDTSDLDRYVDDHFQLDLSAKYRVTDSVQLFYEWVNINNAKYFAYNRFGGGRNLYQYEEYNWTMKGGVRVTF